MQVTEIIHSCIKKELDNTFHTKSHIKHLVFDVHCWGGGALFAHGF
jgi:hypothetical protein